MLRLLPASARAIAVAFAFFGTTLPVAFAQPFFGFDFESDTWTGLGSHTASYTQGGLTLAINTQTADITAGTIPGAEVGPASVHFGDPAPENEASFNLSSLAAFDLNSFGLLNESGAEVTLTIGTSRGSEDLILPYDSLHPNAVALFATTFANDPSIFQDITYFNISNSATGAVYDIDNVRLTVAAVPEPAVWAPVAGLCGLGLAVLRRRRERRSHLPALRS